MVDPKIVIVEMRSHGFAGLKILLLRNFITERKEETGGKVVDLENGNELN